MRHTCSGRRSGQLIDRVPGNANDKLPPLPAIIVLIRTPPEAGFDKIPPQGTTLFITPFGIGALTKLFSDNFKGTNTFIGIHSARSAQTAIILCRNRQIGYRHTSTSQMAEKLSFAQYNPSIFNRKCFRTSL